MKTKKWLCDYVVRWCSGRIAMRLICGIAIPPLLIHLSTYPLIHSLYAQSFEPVVAGNGIKFLFDAPDAQKVTLGGEFNNWSPDKIALQKNPEGIWEIIYPLKEGRYEYKFLTDGVWMDGANLVLELKSKDGKLFIPKLPEVKGTATSYSGKIRFGGKFLGLLYSVYDDDEKRWELDTASSAIHFDLDWNITAFKEANCYARTYLKSESGDYTLKFKQGDFNFTPVGVNLKAYYNEKFIRFDNPLKILDKDVSLRYDGINFFDEANIHKAYGFYTQGVHLSAEHFGFGGKFFWSNVETTSQDDIGLRIKSPVFGEKISFGVSFISNRGVPWAHSSSSKWFPNPETPEGRSYDASVSTQPWYKGYREAKKTAYDMSFVMHDKVLFFCEYLTGDEKLVATRWNESRGTDVAVDKSWDLKNITDVISGFKVMPVESVVSEISYRNKKQKLGSVLYSGYEAGTDLISGKVKYEVKKFSAGLIISQEKSKKIDREIIIDGDIYPYYRAAYTNHTSTSVYFIPEKDFFIMPVISVNLKNFEATLKSEFHNYKTRDITKTGGVLSTNRSLPLLSVKTQEVILEHSVSVYGPFYFDGSTRYSYLALESKKRSYISSYLAAALKLKKNVSIKLGWGVDPEGFDEDIYEDIDKREEFLYNNYLATSSIHKAEKLLQLEKRISLKTEIRF
ncbi:MAG: hypothetical protein HY919_01250 [Elusimicrobia bacterium]|nr:hypothetical protein [Elusimicrobiota bacterium]